MANFAAQIKDKFLGLVDRVTTGTGFGRATATGGKGVQEPTKLHTVQHMTVRSRGEPVVDGGSSAGAN